MILWHCTTIEKEVIEANGLQPGPDSWRDWLDLLRPATPQRKRGLADGHGRLSRPAFPVGLQVYCLLDGS
jgi:hypothetical protein